MSELPIVSVTELVSAFKEVIETALPPCCVEGEISNCRRSPAGHYYLTLKDENAEIGAVIWRTAAGRLKFQPRDGMQVLATGALQVYVARGNCQFIINRLLPQGVGELEIAFRQLKEKLESEGLFSSERKRTLPAFPRRIALVTSPTGAAVKDMIHVLRRRWPAARLVVVPVRVQGELAGNEIAAALKTVHLIPDVDVVITGRGGGSLEDLWAFNEEVVARAIAACRLPVVSAVGHETDVSISDLVADRRALTPSEAAELVVPAREEVRQTLLRIGSQIYRLMTERIRHLKITLAQIESRRIFQNPTQLIDDRRQRCDDLADRAERAMRMKKERLEQKLAAMAASLEALSPLRVLARGYSLTTLETGALVSSIQDVEQGQVIRTTTADGVILSAVDSVSPDDVETMCPTG